MWLLSAEAFQNRLGRCLTMIIQLWHFLAAQSWARWPPEVFSNPCFFHRCVTCVKIRQWGLVLRHARWREVRVWQLSWLTGSYGMYFRKLAVRLDAPHPAKYSSPKCFSGFSAVGRWVMPGQWFSLAWPRTPGGSSGADLSQKNPLLVVTPVMGKPGTVPIGVLCCWAGWFGIWGWGWLDQWEYVHQC